MAVPFINTYRATALRIYTKERVMMADTIAALLSSSDALILAILIIVYLAIGEKESDQ